MMLVCTLCFFGFGAGEGADERQSLHVQRNDLRQPALVDVELNTTTSHTPYPK